jgi:type IV pilus assembly protein PilA
MTGDRKMNVKANIQKGFTLIELMIVVAIIGILAAIAIPQYQDYVARSQVSEAVQLMGGAKTAIEEQVSQTGTFPTDNASGHSADPATGALPDLGVKVKGSYVASMAATPTSGGGGILTVTMKSTDVSAEISGETVRMERSATGEWTCIRGTTNAISDEHLPTSCENDAAS